MLNNLSNALLIAALCFLFLVFHKAAHAQSTDDETVSPLLIDHPCPSYLRGIFESGDNVLEN